MVLPEDPGKLNMDSWGLKRCYSHLLRRWLAGTVTPRATSPKIMMLPCKKKENLCDIIQCGSPQIVNLFCNHNNQGL